MLNKILAPLSACCLALAAQTALAGPPKASQPPTAQAPKVMDEESLAQHHSDIVRIENYLSKLTTIVSDFTQVAPDGSLTGGKFYLRRPGKMRWQYDPPTPILMVADEKFLIYYDYELEQVSHIPLDGTLIGFLAQKQIVLDGKAVSIIELEKTPGKVLVSLIQSERPTDGQLTLEFSDNPLLLRNMVVTDSQGQITTVSLNNARFDVDIDPELFVFRDPRKQRRK